MHLQFSLRLHRLLLPQLPRLLPHEPPQELPARRLRYTIDKLDAACKVLVRDLVVFDVLQDASASCKRENAAAVDILRLINGTDERM